jgi:HSP20 family protein
MALYPTGRDLWPDPLSTLRRIQDEVNRTFGDFRLVPTAEYPPVNVWRSEDGVAVTAEVPGVSLSDMEITVHQNTLTIKGRREPEAKEPDVAFHRRERDYGAFARTLALPFNVDADRVKARAHAGILIIELPRPEAEKPKRITIKTA